MVTSQGNPVFYGMTRVCMYVFSIENGVILGGDPLGFSSFLDMLIHTIKELIMHNYSSVPQTVPEIWLTHISAGHKGPIS